MEVETYQGLLDDNQYVKIGFTKLDMARLPGWCLVLIRDIQNHYGKPLEILDAVHAIAHQLHNQATRNNPDTPPPWEGTLKAETNEVGSGTAGDTDATRKGTQAPETYGAPAPEGGEEVGGVAQGVQRINEQRFNDIEDWLEDLEVKIGRLEAWALHFAGVKQLLGRPRGGGETI